MVIEIVNTPVRGELVFHSATGGRNNPQQCSSIGGSPNRLCFSQRTQPELHRFDLLYLVRVSAAALKSVGAMLGLIMSNFFEVAPLGASRIGLGIVGLFAYHIDHLQLL